MSARTQRRTKRKLLRMRAARQQAKSTEGGERPDVKKEPKGETEEEEDRLTSEEEKVKV